MRLSAFDFVPFYPDPEQSEGKKLGQAFPKIFPNTCPINTAFGIDANNPIAANIAETCRFLELLRELDIVLVNLSAGSPYYNPHIQRPAYFPPSDGYQPPKTHSWALPVKLT